MSTTERRIVFSAEDAGVERTMDNLRKRASDVSREISRGSNEAHKSARDTLDAINNQVDALEKRNRADSQSNVQRMRSDSQGLMRDFIRDAASSESSASGQISYIESQIAQIQKRSQRDTQRRIYEANIDRDERLENARDHERSGILDEHRQKISGIKTSAREDQIQVELLREILEAIQQTSQEEIRESKDEVQRQLDKYDDILLRGEPEEGAEEEFLRRNLQRETLGGDEKKSPFGDIVGGLLLGRAMQTAATIPGARTEEDVIGKMIEVIPVTIASALSTKIAGFGVDLAAIGATAGGVASGAYTRSVEEGLRAETASNRLMATAGISPFFAKAVSESFGVDLDTLTTPTPSRDDDNPFAPKLHTAESDATNIASATFGTKEFRDRTAVKRISGPEFFGQRFGFNISESMEMMAGLGSARGTSDGLLNVTEESLALQRAFGLDPNQISRVAGRRLRGAGDGSPISDVSDLISIMRSSGGFSDDDFTRLSAILEAQNSILEEQSTYLENLDPSRASAVLGMFAGTGGSFDILNDERAVGRIMSLNSALRQPGNDYQQAMNFAVLGRSNPNMSYFDMLMAQEQGITNPDLLMGSLDMIRSQFGTGEQFRLGVMNRFGMGANQANELSRMYEGGELNSMTERQVRSILDGGSGGRDEVMRRAEQFTADLQVSQAKVTDAFTQGAVDGMAKVTELTAQKIEEVADAVISKILNIDRGSKSTGTPQFNSIP